MNFVYMEENRKVAFEKVWSNFKSHHAEIKIKNTQRHCPQHTTSKEEFKILHQIKVYFGTYSAPQSVEYL